MNSNQERCRISNLCLCLYYNISQSVAFSTAALAIPPTPPKLPSLYWALPLSLSPIYLLASLVRILFTPTLVTTQPGAYNSQSGSTRHGRDSGSRTKGIGFGYKTALRFSISIWEYWGLVAAYGTGSGSLYGKYTTLHMLIRSILPLFIKGRRSKVHQSFNP